MRPARWIITRLNDYQRTRQTAKLQRFLETARIYYLGGVYRLQAVCDPAKPQGCMTYGDIITVNIAAADLSPRGMQEEITLEVKLWLKKSAAALLRERTEFWAGHMGVRYRKMALSEARRRWGSCSHRNIIRLNWRLIMTPAALIDYVVAHELAHVAHKNHSRHFWDFLGTAMPDYRERRQQLRAFERKLREAL